MKVTTSAKSQVAQSGNLQNFFVTLTCYKTFNIGAILNFKKNVCSKSYEDSNGTIKLKKFPRFKHLN